ncbi:MAG: hypothetical protein V5A44_00900 [Haloarculaceae archaeon]
MTLDRSTGRVKRISHRRRRPGTHAFAELGQRLDGHDVSVRATSALEELFDLLCYEPLDALVLPEPLDASPLDVLCGVRAFYPNSSSGSQYHRRRGRRSRRSHP